MKFLFYLFIFFQIFNLSAQAPYGHEWIEFSKPHYKFSIINNNIYRIPYSFISANCPEIAAANSSEICIFFNGVQIPIFISWSSAPTGTDYIEFYGKKLETEVDKRLFLDTNFILNQNASLFKDTGYYFLTLRSGSNQRYISISNDTTSITNSYLGYSIGNSIFQLKTTYNEGRRMYYNSTEYVYSPFYDDGEGWSTANISGQTIPTPGFLSIPNEPAKLHVRIFGRNEASHRLEFKLNSTIIGEANATGSKTIIQEFSFPSSQISSANSILNITPLIANNHGYMLGSVRLRYPRNFDFTGLGFYSFSLPTSASYEKILISNYNSSNSVLFYDFINKTRIEHAASSQYRFAIQPQSAQSQLAIAHSGAISFITAVSKVNYSNIYVNEGDFIILAHRNLQYDSTGADVIEEYKSYKESTAGGSFNVEVMYTDDLANLFGYGIPKHPIAIRKYLQWGYNTWAMKPKYALIMGKGYSASLLGHPNPNFYNNIHIPSFGHAPSDYGYTTMDSSLAQFIPIGRISTIKPQEVRNYLNKLKEYNKEYLATSPQDQNPSKKEYMKWLIHLGGGNGIDEQANFRNNLKSYESKIKDQNHGARVFSIFKNGPDISQDITSIDLTNRINQGVSFITFFGHSASTIFDVGIGDPTTFTNKGKYPFFLANGCNSGNFFLSTTSYAENFVNLPDKGAIGFIATTNTALDIALYSYGNTFYENLSKTKYNNSIGNLMQKTSQDLMAQGLNYINTTPMEFNLSGDPSVRVTQYDKPDWYIDNSSMILPTQNLNTTMDSFPIKVIVQNLGKAVSTPIKMRIERVNNGKTVLYEKTVSPPYFKDTFKINIPIKDEEFGIGLNTFNLKIESDNIIAELSEDNNEVKNIGNLLIENDDVIPIFPYEYSILGTNTSLLTAMSTLFSEKSQVFHFQIDTTPLFNSPNLKSYSTSPTSETVVKWNPLIVFQDSLVYYWRVSRDTTGRGYRWNNSSFIYIPNQTMGGWNQSHYYQFLNNQFQNINLNSNRKFEFVSDVKNVFCRTDGSSTTYEVEWYLNNARVGAMREAGRMTNGFFVIWIDGKTGYIQKSYDTLVGSKYWGAYGSIDFGFPGADRWGFVFQDTGMTPSTHPTPNIPWSQVFLNFANQVPSGDYLIFYTYKKPVYNKWDQPLIDYFKNAGFSGIQSLVDTVVKAPFIFGYQKNTPSFTPISKIGTDYISKTTQNVLINGTWKEGYTESVKIGPAQKWQTLSYELVPSELNSKDSNVVELYGYKSNKQRDLLAKFNVNKLDTSLTWINPAIYTELLLKLNSSDDKDRTPSQLKYWRIYYDDIGELAVNHLSSLIPKSKDTIENGENINLYLAAEALNSKSFDSVSLKMTISQGSQSKTTNLKIQPIAGNKLEVYQTDVKYKNYFEGDNFVTYEINPKNQNYQLEKYNVNNFGRAKFYVKTDKENPLLDVTFDGVHIVNNELVSCKPSIKIVLKDENKFLLLNDTNVVDMYLKLPDGSLKQLYFGQSDINYVLASSSNDNRLEINLNPSLVDGSYQLIIKDNDISGNSSSTNPNFDYKASFQVISKNQVSHFINYPNPFTTSTQFVFTLTGAKVPDVIKITITNIRGQVVKEINKEELGPIKLGLNRTQYAWDGRDQYGDLLANGVYLYKVTIRDNGQDYPMMEDADFKALNHTTKTVGQYFKNGWGKMVILR